MARTAPEWPRHVELVEATVLNLKPGDSLVVRPKDEQITLQACQELKDFLEWTFPDTRIVVVGLAVELDVIRAPAAEDHPADPDR